MEQNPQTPESSQLPILIVDKKGMIGDALQKKFREQFLTVYVTASVAEHHDNVIAVSWRKRLPTVPDNMYSHIFVVYNGEKELLDMLPGFVKKARESKGKVIFITSLLFSSIKLLAYLQHASFQDIKIVIFGAIINEAKTIIWNGPVGYIENQEFKRGTDFLYYAITQNEEAISVVGGGDTLAALSKKEYLDKITHISTGGGAMLEFIENGTLPGLEALK